MWWVCGAVVVILAAFAGVGDGFTGKRSWWGGFFCVTYAVLIHWLAKTLFWAYWTLIYYQTHSVQVVLALGLALIKCGLVTLFILSLKVYVM